MSEVADWHKNAAESNSVDAATFNSHEQHLQSTDVSFCDDSLERLDADLEKLPNTSCGSSSKATSRLSNDLFMPLTLFVNSQTVLSEIVSEQHGSSVTHRLMLTGLHTCGNLSADILRLFVATPSAEVLCQIGCCYNLLSERFLHDLNFSAYGNITTVYTRV